MHVRNLDYMLRETDLQPHWTVFQQKKCNYYKILVLVCTIIIVVAVVITTTRASNHPLCRVSAGT